MTTIDTSSSTYAAGRNLWAAHQAPNPIDLDVTPRRLGEELAARSSKILAERGATDAEIEADGAACIAHVCAGYEDARGDVRLTAEQAATLLAENDRQERADRYEIGDTSTEAEAAFAARAASDPAMAEIVEMQEALPRGARLLWPDGTVARLASVDLA